MNPGNLSPCSVTPVGHLLARCVAKGLLSQEELDAISRDTEVFPHQQEAQQRITTQRQIDDLKLQMELLTLEKDIADVTHEFYLSQRFASLQQFSTHLQSILVEQNSLCQRLMKPICQTNLPVQADLHRYVVDAIKMMVVFIQKLEKNINIVHTIPMVDDSKAKLNNGVAQLLAQMKEVERLSKLVERRMVNAVVPND